MKVGIEVSDKDIYTIVQILNSHLNEEIELKNILLKILIKNIRSSDLLFLTLQKLEREGFVRGHESFLKIGKEIGKEETRKIIKEILNETKKNKKLFVTPLEVGKFYQCPRRLFLEKIVLAKQYKERKGKTWDGEVVHSAINFLIKNLGKKSFEEVVDEAAKNAINRYKEKTTIDKKKLNDFLIRFYELIKEENFLKIFTEKTFQSFKIGLIGTPDLVGIKEREIIPIDIKLGKVSKKGVKEEHLLQNIGEAILIENFFREKINSSYLIYFGSNSLVKIDLDKKMRGRFLRYKREIERMCTSTIVPLKGRMLNLKRRVCLGCHVRPSCENIENLKRIIY